MINNQKWTRALLGALIAMTLATVAEAQIGGLIKRKANEAIKGPEKKDEKAAGKTVPTPTDRLEMTEPVLDGFIAGLGTEISLRKEFRAELAKLPTKDQYNQCLSKLVTSPEYQKIQLSLGNLPENATAAQLSAVMKKQQDDTEALLKKTCPVNPEDFSDYKKQQRLTEIKTKAAKVANLAGSTKDDAAQTTVYDATDELVLALCKALPGANLADVRVNGLKHPGTGNNIYWLFTAVEVRAGEKKCGIIMPLIEERDGLRA